MCKKTNFKIPNPRIDKCMRNLVNYINREASAEEEVIACCCGHKKYPMTILVKIKWGGILEIVSNKLILRTRNFYKRDKQVGC